MNERSVVAAGIGIAFTAAVILHLAVRALVAVLS